MIGPIAEVHFGNGIAFEDNEVGADAVGHLFLKRFESHQPKDDGKPNDPDNGDYHCVRGVPSRVEFPLRGG